jgi:hypothetical protein
MKMRSAAASPAAGLSLDLRARKIPTMRTGALLMIFALAACAGCGSADSHEFTGETVPVKGKVTYKGKPLTRGEVVFEPDSAGREAHGEIQPDGRFELSTYKAGDGAVAGTHRVAVRNTGKNDAVPVKYKNASSSRTEVEVTAGKTEYVIDLN